MGPVDDQKRIGRYSRWPRTESGNAWRGMISEEREPTYLPDYSALEFDDFAITWGEKLHSTKVEVFTRDGDSVSVTINRRPERGARVHTVRWFRERWSTLVTHLYGIVFVGEELPLVHTWKNGNDAPLDAVWKYRKRRKLP